MSYFSILSDSSCLFAVRLFDLSLYSKSLIPHLPHNLLGLFIFKIIQLVPFRLSLEPFLFFSLLLLLHDDLIPDHFLHDDVVEDAPQELVLHI